ncbi:hypothetical protein F4808DRAFT_184899 [Astrocystis sublimbata]|nr:hypothetical protein F4808DRAFT_184899 [Astrocystis sublimbata]
MAETASPPTATPKRKRDELEADMGRSASPTSLYAANNIFSFRLPTLQPDAWSHGRNSDGSSSPQSRITSRFGRLAIQESSEDVESNNIGSELGSGGGVPVAAAGAEAEAGGAARCQIKPAPSSQLPFNTAARFNFNAGTPPKEDMHLDHYIDNEDGAVYAAARKRTKPTEADSPVSGPATADATAREAGSYAILNISVSSPSVDRLPAVWDSTIKNTIEVDHTGHLRQSVTSSNRPTGTKPRRRKRVETPPPSSRRKGNAQSHAIDGEDDEEVVIVDPVRAALTWHEDEITVYDPEDKDDDGTGINGIGFKPTAAVAYQRAQKRRQQLLDYKKREESEARAKRTQRRREQLGGGTSLTRNHSMIRVHFSEAPPTTIMTT